MTAGRFAIDAETIVSEIIDGEAIVIHLETGCYYSLDRVGAEIWSLLQRQLALPAIVAAVRQRYDCTGIDPEPAVRALVDRLREERLIAVAELPGDPGVAEGDPPRPPGEPREPFRAPAMQKYVDMQDFLLVDPIHEVDDAGWPHPRSRSTA
jgi:hypothetical protein